MCDDARCAWFRWDRTAVVGSAGDGTASIRAGNGPDRVDTGGKVLRSGPSPSESASGDTQGDVDQLTVVRVLATRPGKVRLWDEARMTWIDASMHVL
jgi:hypothetical protein